MNTAEDNIENIQEEYAQETYVKDLTDNIDERFTNITNGLDGRVGDTENEIATIKNTYTKIEDVGTVGDMMYPDSKYVETFLKITDLIGNIEELNQALDPTDKSTKTMCLALSQAIQGLKNEIQVLKALDLGTDARLKIIEEQLGINS